MRCHDQLLSPTVNNDSLSAKHLNDLEQTSRDLSKVISRFLKKSSEGFDVQCCHVKKICYQISTFTGNLFDILFKRCKNCYSI